MPRTKIFVLAFYILCNLPVCLATLFALPPGQAFDESSHMSRADGLLHGAIMAVRKTDIDKFTGKPEPIVGLKVDRGLLQVARTSTPTTQTDLDKLQALPSDHTRVFHEILNTARYFPIAYIPGALGLALGFALHLSPYLTFLCGRAFMLLAFLTLGGLALWVTSFGEVWLLAILICPMSVTLGGTLNQDAILAAMTCLACALLTKAGPWRRYTALALLAGMISAKLPYILLLAAAAFPLTGPGHWRRLWETAIAYLPVLLWAVLTALFVSAAFGRAPYHPGPLYIGDRSVWLDHTDPQMGLRILLHPPERLFSIFYESTKYYMRFYLREFVEPTLPLTFPPPTTYDWGWGVAYVSALLGLIFNPRPERLSGLITLQNFIGIMALLVLTYWLMLITLYMDWSLAGEGLLVYGFQGRYFLLMLPFLLLAVPGWRGRLVLPVWLPALPVIGMGIFDLGYLPLQLINQHYLH